ncbi:hypothetical protein FRC10_010288 [Ceratobasidium sp. 414]|nr:hypothetical protein FRC10_010288 [Ceratobasidium sp. 414]
MTGEPTWWPVQSDWAALYDQHKTTSGEGGDSSGDADADADAGAGADADADADAEADAEADAGADANASADANAGTDANAGADADAGAEGGRVERLYHRRERGVMVQYKKSVMSAPPTHSGNDDREQRRDIRKRSRHDSLRETKRPRRSTSRVAHANGAATTSTGQPKPTRSANKASLSYTANGHTPTNALAGPSRTSLLASQSLQVEATQIATPITQRYPGSPLAVPHAELSQSDSRGRGNDSGSVDGSIPTFVLLLGARAPTTDDSCMSISSVDLSCDERTTFIYCDTTMYNAPPDTHAESVTGMSPHDNARLVLARAIESLNKLTVPSAGGSMPRDTPGAAAAASTTFEMGTDDLPSNVPALTSAMHVPSNAPHATSAVYNTDRAAAPLPTPVRIGPDDGLPSRFVSTDMDQRTRLRPPRPA